MPAPAFLIGLPGEIRLHLSRYIDYKSACNLARTCRDLQDFGEAIIWKDLDFFSHTYYEDDNRRHYSSPYTGRIRHTTRFQMKEHRHREEVPVDIDILRSVHHGLTNRKARRTLVSRLSILVTGTNYRLVADLLNMVQSNLVELYLPATPFPVSWDPVEDQFFYRAFFDLISTVQFPRMRSLSLPLDKECQSASVLMMKVSPNVESLTINPISRGDEPPEVRDSQMELLNLRRLKVDVFFRGISDMIFPIFSSSKLLSYVEITSVSGGDIEFTQRVIRALETLPGLRELSVPEGLSFTFRGNFTGLRKLTLDTHYNLCYGRSLMDVQIPPLPCLEELVYRSQHNPAHTHATVLYPCVVTENRHLSSAPTKQIPKATLQQLMDAPSLTRITIAAKVQYPKSWLPKPTGWDGDRYPAEESFDIHRMGNKIRCLGQSHIVVEEEGDVIHLSQIARQEWVGEHI